ncbi:MAG: helix-turn-helix domain-containing protein, partial [Firmicutes bacterium]|nr:helix-turn-helix domain-containing protein [Bacillota bacterium]
SLFIARQSLYQRIKVLETFLGSDFISSPQKRACLDIALYGLDYINGTEETQSKNFDTLAGARSTGKAQF